MAYFEDRKHLGAPREVGFITLVVGLLLFFAPVFILGTLSLKPFVIQALAPYLPGWLVTLTGWLISIVFLLVMLPLVMMYQTWLERKLVARIQDRIGPNRAGRYGMMVPLADGIKMLLKEDIVPRGADRLLHFLAPVVILIPSLLIYSVLPMGENMIPVDLSIGILFFIAISSYSVIAIIMAGYASHSKYPLLGAMRSAAQIISYDIPLAMSVVTPIMIAGALSTVKIVETQQPLWFVFTPWGLTGALLFFICGLAEVNRTPFDLPEAESELVSGFHTEYSGMKFALFYMAEFLSSFAICGLIVTLFLGGWLGPFSTYIGWLFFLFKTYAVFFVMVWLRGTLPRLRVDQLMGFAWKFLLPMTLINIVVAAAWWYVVGPEWGAQVWTPLGIVRQLLGWAVGLAILVPSYTWLARLTFTAPELTEKAELKP